jgi:transposase
VAQATGLSRNTIQAGIKELEQRLFSPEISQEPGRIRRPGGGRKPLMETDPALLRDLQKLLDSSTRGDPQSPLKWTSKSTQHLAEELNRKGHQVSPDTVARLLHALDYSLQSHRKSKEGTQHPDRDDQFKYINREVRAFQRRG